MTNKKSHLEGKTQPASPVAEVLTNEALALTEIVVWFKECCPWQQDALRRLCLQAELTDADIDELARICKAEATALPVSAEHIRDPKAAAAAVNLRSVHSVNYVNALAEGERLTFDKSGVTVVYGDNGSGKSGYIRILKKMCRARSPKDDHIVSNIYSSKNGTPTACIDFSVNGQNKDSTWVNGQAAEPLLSSVSVFDSRTANVHVDQTNNVAYTPLPMKVLEGLAQMCQQIKQRLTAEIAAIEQQTPASIKKTECRPHTKVGKLLEKLDGKTDPKTVRSLATVTAAETARLQTLKADLASDPAKTARALQAQKTRLDGQITFLQSLHAAVSKEKVDALRKLQA